MQWRYLHSQPDHVYYDQEGLAEIIMGRIKHMEAQIQDGQRVNKATEAMSQIKGDFLKLFKFADDPNDLLPSNINSFREIGMSDPFPDDD